MPVRLVNTAISAGWLILAVMVLRALLRKAPRGMVCLLWALVAVRLLCPFSLKSSLSLVPDPAPLSEAIVAAAAAVPSESEDRASPAVPPAGALSDAGPTPEVPSIRPSGTAIWLAGTALMAAYALASYLRLRRRVAASLRIKGEIYICDQIASPFLLGLVRPRVYLPSGMEPEQFSYVLAHEHAHLKRRDNWWKALGFGLLAVYWFQPLCWAAYILLCRDMELACDEMAVREMDVGERRRYAEILLACSAAGPIPTVCPLTFGEVSVKARIRSVLHYRRPAVWTAVAAAAAGLALGVCFLTDPPDHADAAAVPSPAPTMTVHRVEYAPPSPSPAPVTPKPAPTRPTKGQVLAARKEALAGMTQTQIDRLTSVITSQNLWWEREYLDNILTRLDDPDDLAWNYFEETGDIDVGEGISYEDETGLTGDERLALCEKEGITVDEFFEKYGTKTPILIGGYSKYSVDEIVSMIGQLRDTVQNQDLRTDLAYLSNQILWARETHRMLYVSNMFKLLHDLDYFLLRYGPDDQPSTDPYYNMPSVVSNYYGMLTAFGADHGEGSAPS